MQLKYRNTQYSTATNPTFIPSEILQGTYRGLSMPISINQPTVELQTTEQVVQYRGVKTTLRYA